MHRNEAEGQFGDFNSKDKKKGKEALGLSIELLLCSEFWRVPPLECGQANSSEKQFVINYY